MSIRAAAALSSLFLTACIGVNPDWDPPRTLGETGGSTSGEGSGGTRGETGTSSGEDTSTGAMLADLGGGRTGEQICGESAPNFGSCPPECDSCAGGVCQVTCTGDECEDGVIVGPENWSYDLRCVGKDACKKATIDCRGEGTCALHCFGEHACEGVVFVCSDGPCMAQCAADSHHPCKDMVVACGTNDSQLVCEPGSDHGSPQLLDPGPSDCSCTKDCRDDGDDDD